jgi:hypothetical protein
MGAGAGVAAALAAGGGALALALYGNSQGWWSIPNPFGTAAAARAIPARSRAAVEAERAARALQPHPSTPDLTSGVPSSNGAAARWGAGAGARYIGGIAPQGGPVSATGYSAGRYMAAQNTSVPAGRRIADYQPPGSQQQGTPGLTPTLAGRAGATSVPKGLASGTSARLFQ